MSWTPADLDALERAIADGRGARIITFDDQSVTFHSLAEMLTLRERMRATVHAAAHRPFRLAVVRKGVS